LVDQKTIDEYNLTSQFLKEVEQYSKSKLNQIKAMKFLKTCVRNRKRYENKLNYKKRYVMKKETSLNCLSKQL
jgi:hypothetical protein